MTFNLFAAEEQAIEQARLLGERLGAAAPELRADFEALVEAFQRSTREQRRLVRVSDRLQAQLGSANQELERRRQEAETALADLREAQEAMVRAEKLASLGALVAGVAHEINTPVGIAVSCASHLSDATARLRGRAQSGELSKSDFSRYVATATDTTALILTNCERAAKLIASFKQVAVDRASAERRVVHLNRYIQETLVSLEPKLRQGKHSIIVSCPDGLVVDTYPGALSQILTNFVMNSVTHAFVDAHGAEGQGGSLSIAVDEPEPGTVRLVYTDNGRGIPPDHLPRVFDPFFTTRRGEGGSGLGLHIVHNLAVGALKGTISVDSAPGQGTRFVLTFPKDTPPDDAAA
ncbi:HAMP domain-containing histidine kinase [Azospirillum sp. YIM DDC1]|uniref:histidine kinase n=1 Tax=Azospirillum aestuarii TaxID=2802052 RepID=A0ABS1HYG4_9PROT|nr:HAMP domain-containing sensor histidine kinase [Azospirillum aestuarii]MBK4719866.1 HAMP domain-containing histidine kinase [Azospirillum aestuarii]TWA89349.1 histidine kinase/DNA gyrase B/HSP90-like ATPase [Azospirillum brasilense]